MPAVNREAQITVSDIYGKVLTTTTISKNDRSQQLQFNLAGQQPGIYYIQVRNGDDHYANKIVLQ
jgi:hypothetical protein